ncbi:DUF4435 domain-containing protein [Paraburkholderia nodosa]|uniref:DUF4435 domain-containing protein n=1 Tax=Paraburkholderia nodosa TaxID=392320 RepID=UPI0009F496A3|nr:DUF4435 domain-containing protein [Paraburkholderia nodosa]
MDYVEELEAEARNAESVFHEFTLTIADVPEDAFFGFFEGDEDPAFYMAHIAPRLNGRQFISFICNGRTEVLKANEMILSDGRSVERTLFFVDRDHTEIMGGAQNDLPGNVFQTSFYSIENYLICDEVFRRFWVERLHLSVRDSRFDGYLSRFKKLRGSFLKRARILMAIVLFGRGIDGRGTIKLNLNNVQFDRVIRIDFGNERCAYRKKAGKHFLASSNISQLPQKPGSAELRMIYRKYLAPLAPSVYVRGKYELWFFWKLLTSFTRELGDREAAKSSGARRATPAWNLPESGCVEGLASLISCPAQLAQFLDARILAASLNKVPA